MNKLEDKKNIRLFRDDFNKIVEEKSHSIAITAINSADDTKETDFTYSEIKNIICRISHLFKQANVQSGDDILVILPNSSELAIIFLTCLYSGINFIPMPCEITNKDIENIFSITNPKMCIISKLISPKFQNTLKAKSIEILAIETNTLFDWLPIQQIDINPQTSAKIYITTSGTTGEPKLMVIESNKLWSSGYEFLKYHNLLDSTLRFWNYLPMSYLGGLFNLLLIPLLSKGSAVITETFSGKTYLSFWQNVERFNIDALWFTPSIVKGISTFGTRIDENIRKTYAKNIKASFLGTAPINLETKEEFENQFGLTLLENFALSETTFFSSESSNTISNRTESSVGEILPYVKLKFKPLENNIYEIMVKTPFLFDGYLTKNGITMPETDSEGFFATADLGYINDKNTLVITGRSRDIIKKGGYFISLREIECLSEQDSDVKEAVAVKIPHDFYGESYNLYIILKNEAINADEIRHRILVNLIKYKWPEKIIIKNAFPRTSSGKVIKKLLIED